MSAGSPNWRGCGPHSRISPWAWRRLLAKLVEGGAKLRRAKNPPIINKARYKFLGLNLDYSIEKARQVLGYQPPFTFDEAIERAMAEHRPAAARRIRSSCRLTAGKLRSLKRTFFEQSVARRIINEQRERQAQRAVLVEKFYEDLELWYPVLRLREAGCDVKIVGPKAGETYLSKHGYPAQGPMSPPARSRRPTLDAVIIPGGYSPDHMRRCPAMVDLVTQASADGQGSGGHLPRPVDALLGPLPDGRKVTGFFAIRDDVVNAGGIWQDAACVRDGNLVTSRTPDDLPAFMEGIFAALVEASLNRS